MKIFFDGIQLTDWEDFPAQGVTLNGETVFEAVDIVRASKKRFFHRGNDAVALSFSVRREFGTHRECQVYLLTHFSLLPKFGVCQVICGVPGEVEQSVFLANAVLTASPQGTFAGVESVVQYSIAAGSASTDVPPDFLLGGEPMILRGSEPIDTAAESVVVVFDPAFAPGTAPIVNVSVGKPAGGVNLWATVRNDLTTVNGFTAELSGPAPADHTLQWSAIGA